MSSLRHPVGPQPPQVYWRRRALVAAVLLAVVLVVVLIVARPGAGDEGSETAVTATPTTTPVAEASAPPATAPAADATEPAGAPAASGDAPACVEGQIELEPVTDGANYAPGELPQISMSITNSGRDACAIDLGSAQQELVISSGEDRYWSSKDCQVNATDQLVVVDAGETLSTPPIAWDRTRSSPDTCDDVALDPVPAEGASYRLSVSVGDVTSTDTRQMILN